MRMAEILSFGEPLAEFNQTQAGSAAWRLGYGGDTSNFCIAAARQGASVDYISATGDDRFGQGLRDLWQAEGVGHSHVRTDPQAPTVPRRSRSPSPMPAPGWIPPRSR